MIIRFYVVLGVAMLLVVLRWVVLLLSLAVVVGWFGVLEVQGVGATVAERVVRY